MALPVDAYPLATQDGQQIRLDVVRLIDLTAVVFTSTTGTASDASLIVTDALYVFLASADCIIYFTGVATGSPIKAKAVFAAAGERVSCMLPAGATGISVVGIGSGGTLYVQTIENWAGLANATTLRNQ